MATLDCKLLATATKVEAVLDVEREAKIAKEMSERMRFPLQVLDNRAWSTDIWLLRSVTSHFPALLAARTKLLDGSGARRGDAPCGSTT